MLLKENIRKVHLVGICGIGVSALARYFVSTGVKVSGSDLNKSSIANELRELGIVFYKKHSKKNVCDDIDLLVYSSAISLSNPEIIKAKEIKIPVLSYTQTLGMLMKNRFGIAVSGTNGKTTTTALLGKILETAGKDPTVVVGGKVSGWENFRAGNGEILLAEGCEYRRNMLDLDPRIIILTNIEEDHLDYYRDIEDIRNAFMEYVQKLPKNGVLVYNAEDENIIDVCVCCSRALKISFGFNLPLDLYPKNVHIEDGWQVFNLVWRGKAMGVFKTRLPGKYNIYNILAATATALHLGVTPERIKKALQNFKGVGRRFEYVRNINGVDIISDYAHHPTAIKSTIEAAKEMYKGERVLTVFQPHQKDRTIKLFDEFTKSFDKADEVILSEIYDVAGRNEVEHNISSKDLVKAIRKRNPRLSITYTANLTETKKIIKEKTKHGSFGAVLIMGAGDIDKVARKSIY